MTTTQTGRAFTQAQAGLAAIAAALALPVAAVWVGYRLGRLRGDDG